MGGEEDGVAATGDAGIGAVEPVLGLLSVVGKMESTHVGVVEGTEAEAALALLRRVGQVVTCESCVAAGLGANSIKAKANSKTTVKGSAKSRVCGW